MYIPLALISLAVGFKVFVEATKETNSGHRTFGRILALYIMILSFALSAAPLCKAHCRNMGANGGCPILSKMCLMK